MKWLPCFDYLVPCPYPFGFTSVVSVSDADSVLTTCSSVVDFFVFSNVVGRSLVESVSGFSVSSVVDAHGPDDVVFPVSKVDGFEEVG